MAPPLRTLIANRAATAPAARLLSDARTPLSVDRAALERAAATWAAELDARGIPPGARVLLDVDDPLALAVALLGVVAAGRCAAPVDPGAPPAEAERARARLGAALTLTDRPDRPGVRIVPGTGMPLAPVAGGADRVPGPGAVVLLTSGSTGVPKAVELAEEQLLHTAAAVARHHRLTGADRGYCPLPLFHVNAQVVGVLAGLVAGAELVLDRRFRRTGFWELIRERDITWINAVPAIIAVLARTEPPASLPDRLRFVRSASASLPPPVRDAFRAATGLPVVESYGMTEAASQITATPLDVAHRPGSVGVPVDVELQVVDRNGVPCAPGVLGRVRIRGAGVIRGYAGGAAAERFTADGWLDTADLGRLDADGWLYLAGRADDVVNRGGELVHPREIEDVLLADAGVAEAVVVGRPHDVLGAVPVACVRPAAGVPADELTERLERRCARELAAFKRPVEIRLVGAFPVGPTGKVRRSALRAGLALGTVDAAPRVGAGLRAGR